MVPLIFFTLPLLLASYSPPPLRELDIYASGTISITGKPKGFKLQDLSGKKCPINSKVHGNRLSVTTGKCQANLSISGFPSFALNIHSDESDIKIKSVRGPITIRQRAGKIALSDINQSIDIRLSDGTIRAHQLTANARIWQGRGSVILDYSSLRPGTKINILTGEADAEVMLPHNSRIALTQKVKFGTVVSDFVNLPTPDAKVNLISESGRFLIRKAMPPLP